MNLQQHDMVGKVCLVTGATAGIGKITATALATQGAEVIIAGRNQQKTEDTVQQIKTETGNESIQYLLADFSDLQQVRELAASFNQRYSRLDVLVNNAGAFFNTRRETSYGVEMTFLVNHLAPFLLTNLLLETIQDSTPARIVNVSSDAHKQDRMNFDDLGFKRGFSGMKAYARSKLANVLFTYELARRLADSDVTANALHPGHVATDIWKTNFSFIGPALKWVMGLFALTPEQGADNTIFLASSPDIDGMTGKYFVKREPVHSSPVSRDEKIAQRLWEISENLTSITQ
ncbi:MAG: SDR family oxidoreductase [Anaerolineales bacterium]|nr:SDR family oxidoreductase [Anaerolineales bacterium]